MLLYPYCRFPSEIIPGKLYLGSVYSSNTLLLGLEDEDVQRAIEIIERNCKTREITSSLLTISMQADGYMPYPLEVKVGGANIFLLDVEEHIVY